MLPGLGMGDDRSEALELLREAVRSGQQAAAELAVLRQQAEATHMIAQSNHHLLHGNGEEGLKGRLSHVERTARETKRQLDEFMGDDAARRKTANDNRQSSLRARLELAGKVVVAVMALVGTVLSTWLAATNGGG